MAATRNRIHTFFVMKEPGAPDRIIVWDTQEISLGRAPENDLTVDHAEISRQHAQFVRSEKSYAVRNLSTSNGTLVNGREVETQALESRDRIEIAEIELTFYQSQKDPVSLGMNLDYASQLKVFPGGGGRGDNAEATMLGLMEPVAGSSDESFQVRSAGDFAYDLHDMEDEVRPAPVPRDLDAELEDFGLDDLDIPVKPATQAPPARQVAPGATAGRPSSTLSLHLEIQGLDGELRQIVESLLGKTLELPALKVRIKDDDLG